MFLRTYAHLYPGDLKAVADAMDLARGAARSAVKDVVGGGGSPRVSRVDFAGMARQANDGANPHPSELHFRCRKPRTSSDTVRIISALHWAISPRQGSVIA